MIKLILFFLLIANSSFAANWQHYLSQNNAEDFSLCSLFHKMGKWESYKVNGNDDIYWVRRQTWINKKFYNETGINIRKNSDWFSSNIVKSSDKSLVYVGPWHDVILTYSNRSFLRELSSLRSYKKTIRLIGAQTNNTLWAYFEEKNKKNSEVKEKKLDLIEPVNLSNMNSLCYIKWTAKHNSYNAKPETIRQLAPGILNKLLLRHEIVVTGKVIEVEE